MEKAKKLTLALHKELRPWVRAIILALSGLLTGLTVAFCELGFLEWITIIPAAIILLRRGSHQKTRLRSIYFDGLLFFYGFYLVCYHFFLSMYPLEFVGLSKGAAVVVVLVAWLGLSLLQALMGACVFLLSAVLFRGRICKKISILKPVIVAAIWAAFEWSQNFGWWGVPWGKLAIGQTKYVLGIQNASWLGSYFISFVIVAVNFFIALALLKACKVKIVKLASSFAVSLLLFQYLSGAIIWFNTDNGEGEKITVACLQGNVSTGSEWNSNTLDVITEVFWSNTRKAAEQGVDIIVWPETALPVDITAGIYGGYDKKCKDLAKETETYILVGAYSTDEDGKCYNSMICYTPEGERLETIYNKRRLVPFGEFIPMRKLFETVIPPLTEIIIPFDDISFGEGASIMNIEDNAVGCLICFDSIYDGLMRETVRAGAEVICLSTNDSWFEGSAALRIHNSHAQLRAIESGRYITRCASTGISTVISPRGEVLDSLEAETEDILVYDVHTRTNRNIWYYVGNAFVYVCLVFVFVLVFDKILVRFKKKSIKNT